MNLPPEILTLIFSHLDANTLKSCLMLSEDIRSLIINTPQPMGKLPVIFYGNNWQEKIHFVDQNADRIRAITFKNCELGAGNDFVEVLKKSKNLEELTLDELTWLEFRKPKYGELLLPKLTKLSISVESPEDEILRHLSNVTSLKTFHMVFEEDYIGTEFMEFVVKQNSLETLTTDIKYVDPRSSCIYIKDCKANIKFKLKVLEVGFPLYYKECLANFLRKQSSTIQELYFVKADFHYIRLVLNNFQNLKKLSFSADQLLNDTRVQEIKNLRMPSVTELKILKCSEDAAAMRVLLNLFPNLEMLSTPLERFSLHGIIENMPKLRKLVLNPCRLEMMCFAKSSSLQELTITNLRPLMMGTFWKKLAEDCPNIVRLTASSIDSYCIVEAVNADVAIIIENLKRFKKLQICELINRFGWRTRAIPERSRDPGILDSSEPNATNQVFRLLLEHATDKPSKLSITGYFNNFHAQAIEKLVEEFNVNEVVVIPDP